MEYKINDKLYKQIYNYMAGGSIARYRAFDFVLSVGISSWR